MCAVRIKAEQVYSASRKSIGGDADEVLVQRLKQIKEVMEERKLLTA
jgi:hypothetical protein